MAIELLEDIVTAHLVCQVVVTLRARESEDQRVQDLRRHIHINEEIENQLQG